MSTGVFEIGKYESDEGDIYPCRVQPETKGLTIGSANAFPLGAADQQVSAKMSSSQKRAGVNARTVRFKFTVAVDGYEDGSTLTLPVFQKTVWDGIKKGDTGTYLGTPVIALGKSPEGIK
jgi:hypothetical protein